jgi:hypothetical protein
MDHAHSSAPSRVGDAHEILDCAYLARRLGERRQGGVFADDASLRLLKQERRMSRTDELP